MEDAELFKCLPREFPVPGSLDIESIAEPRIAKRNSRCKSALKARRLETLRMAKMASTGLGMMLLPMQTVYMYLVMDMEPRFLHMSRRPRDESSRPLTPIFHSLGR